MRFAELMIQMICVASWCYAQKTPAKDHLARQPASGAKHFHTIQYVEELTTVSSGDGEAGSPTIRVTEAYEDPGKLRIESAGPDGTTLIVSDGKETWTYDSGVKQYTKIAGAFEISRAMASLGAGSEMIPASGVSPTNPAKRREETIRIDGVEHQCWVEETKFDEITVPGQNAKAADVRMTTFTDKNLLIDVQTILSMKLHTSGSPDVIMTEKIVKKNIKVDVPIAASLFKFVPPPGTRQVEKLMTLPPSLSASPEAVKVELTGKEAPAFTVQGIDGTSYRLSDLKGKPVLLDFWATWCMPCRESAPAVEALYRDFKDQGLVVLAISDEEPEVVKAFLKTTQFPYPVVLGDEAGVLEPYQVTVYPTFVLIRPDGRIAAYQAGFPGEQALRKLMESVGLTVPARKQPGIENQGLPR